MLADGIVKLSIASLRFPVELGLGVFNKDSTIFVNLLAQLIL